MLGGKGVKARKMRALQHVSDHLEDPEALHNLCRLICDERAPYPRPCGLLFTIQGESRLAMFIPLIEGVDGRLRSSCYAARTRRAWAGSRGEAG